MNVKDNTSYKEMVEYVEQMKESANLLKNMIHSTLEDEGYNIKKVEELHKKITKVDILYQKDDTVQEIFDTIGDFDDEKLRILCRTYHEIEDAPKLVKAGLAIAPDSHEETAEELEARMKKFDETYDSTKYDWMKKVLIKVMDDMDEIDKTYKEADEIQKQADDAVNDYVTYLTSEEYQNKKKERLEKLKEEAKNCKDPKEKKKSLMLIETIESSMNLTFIANRIEAIGEKEYQSLEDNYFDDRRSNYNLSRFKNKITKFGYKEDIYSHFFNIEEKFLEEKYHVYNNLFLFYIIRFVAYSDTDSKKDRLFVQSLISNTANLVYHKFNTEEQKETFLSVIREFLDHYKESYDKFNEKNILHPNHPERLKKEKEHNDSVKEMIYTNLKDMGVEISQEIRDMNMDELRELYDKTLDEKKDSATVKKTDIDELVNKIKETMDTKFTIQDPDDNVSDSDEDSLKRREELRKEYSMYCNLDDYLTNKFATEPIEKLEQMVENVKTNLTPLNDCERATEK